MRLDHVVLPIGNVEQSLSFYREVLGLPLVDALDGGDWGGFSWLMLLFGLSDGRQLVLVHLRGCKLPATGKLPKDSRHIAFGVEGSLHPWRARLADARVEFWEENHGAQRSLYFEDPNGIVLEITSPPTESIASESSEALTRVQRWLAEHRT